MNIQSFDWGFDVTSETDFQLVDLEIIQNVINGSMDEHVPNLHLYDFMKFYDKHNQQWVLRLTRGDQWREE